MKRANRDDPLGESDAARDVFDYVIVGAGAAGCVLANRLSADPATRVCLLEAGPSDQSPTMRLLTTMPGGMVSLLGDARTNWQHTLTGDETLSERTIPCPRGRIVGGTTVVNGMVYSRGNAGDYDHWQQLGNRGWSFDDVLPFFRRHEDFADGESDLHATGGELRVERLAHPHPLTRAFLDAAGEAGYPRNGDFNGPTQDGFGLHHLTQRGGERLGSARAFLDPIRTRANLTIVPDALALRVVIRDLRAQGVQIRSGGRTRIKFARREVVLCAGAINSPQLLMLSGVGDPADLARFGIAVTAALPGVGRAFQDHPGIAVVNRERSGTSVALTLRGLPALVAAPLQYALARRGPLAGSVINGGGFVRTRPGLEWPDIKIDFMPLARPFGKILPRFHGFNVFAWLLRPNSRGRLSLRSAEPADKPQIEPGFFTDEADVATLAEGIRIIRYILLQSSFERYRDAEVAPGFAVVEAAALHAYIRANAGTIYHPVGTCRMGPADDSHAVVDDRLRVRGVDGLRVADASIMPAIVSGNTAAPTMMIAERAADFIHNG